MVSPTWLCVARGAGRGPTGDCPGSLLLHPLHCNIEMVESYRVYKKGLSTLFLLRRLRPFGVQGALPRTLFDSVVTPAIFAAAS